MVNVPNSSVPISGTNILSRDWYQFFSALDREKIAASLLAAQGTILRGGTGGIEAYDAKTANTFLGGNGTTVESRTVAQVLTSLGISFGSWTPTCTINANVDSVSANGPGWYAMLGTNATGGIGIGGCDFNVNATVAANTCNWRFTLPVTPTTFAATENATGAGVSVTNKTMRIRALSGDTIMLVQGVTDSTGDLGFTCVFMWRL